MYWISVASKKQLRSSLSFCYYQLLKPCLRRVVSLLPISSKVLGYPKGFYRSSLDFVKNSTAVDSANRYTEIYPSHAIHRPAPKTVHDNIDWRFLTGYLGSEFITPSNFVLTAINARVVGNDGVVITSDDKLLADVSIEVGVTSDNAEQHSIFGRLKLPKATRINETIAVLSALGGSNYFHWMFDILPRIHLLQKSGLLGEVDKFLINELVSSYQTETLEVLGIPNSQLIQSHPSLHIEAATLIIPSLPGITGSMTKWSCDFLRESFLLRREATSVDKPERIYISRGKAAYRRIINEIEVVEILNSLGFVVVALEKLSVVEQAAVMSSAKVVVSPHGAGLTNLVFCSQGCKVIELFAPAYVNPCYRALCNLLDLEYWYLLGKGTLPLNTSDDHLIKSVQDDIEIDINDLLKTLAAAELTTM